jgi:hypothetical protein
VILTTHVGSLPRPDDLVALLRQNDAAGAAVATFADNPTVDPKIAWAKLGAMVEGARLASRTLWK